MGIFGAMLTAVSGLRSQAYGLENISGNIANSQTLGFKRVDTSFVDLIPDMSPRRETAGSVTAFSRATNNIQGDFLTTGDPTSMALNGDGYFVVREQAGFADNRPVFGAGNLYTRRGDFQLDANGFLVNGAGYYLADATGEPIRIPDTPVPAQATTAVTYTGILPTLPGTPAYRADSTIPNNELLVTGNDAAAPNAPFSNNPRATGSGGDGEVLGQDQAAFINRSIEGGNIPIFNQAGAPIDLNLRWAKVDNTNGSEDWNLFYQVEPNAATGETAWQAFDAPISFNASGQLSPVPNLTIPAGTTIDGTALGAVVAVNLAPGFAQHASGDTVQGGSLQQNGNEAGVLNNVSVTEDGRIAGAYSNGRTLALAQIGIAQFNADNFLRRLDGGALQQTPESGQAVIGLGDSAVMGGVVEGSNTDIAEEFSKMIVTQQAYSANTRVVSTAREMMSDVINMVR